MVSLSNAERQQRYRQRHGEEARAANREHKAHNRPYQDREQRRNQLRARATWRLDPDHSELFAFDGEALSGDEHYDELGGYSPTLGDRGIVAEDSDNGRRITLADAVAFFRRAQADLKVANGKQLRPIGYSIHYDVDQWVRHEPKITDAQKLAIAAQRTRNYGAVRGPKFEPDVILPQLAMRAWVGRKQGHIDLLQVTQTHDGGYDVALDKPDKRGRRKPKVVGRVAWEDVYTLFNTSFIAACEKFAKQLPESDPLRDDLEVIKRGKAARGEWEAHGMTQTDIITYNQAELHWLYHMAGVIVRMCKELALTPRSISSPAHISRALMYKYGCVQHVKPKDYDDVSYQEGPFMAACKMAYFGGFIEQAVQGVVEAYAAYDLVSAYPSEMQHLPCLAHGEARPMTESELQRAREPQEVPEWAILTLQWRYTGDPAQRPTCGPLPWRNKHGEIARPLCGTGAYHTPEVREVLADPNYAVSILSGWVWVPDCEETHPFAPMITETFAERAQYKTANDPKEYVLKLALNSLYGILAQTAGQYRYVDESGTETTGYHSPKFGNLFGAGRITSGTRARLYRVTRSHPGVVFAWATDCVFSFGALDIPTGHGLGEWEMKDERGPALFVAPGIRISPDPQKNLVRGIGKYNEDGKPVDLWEVGLAAWHRPKGWQVIQTYEKRYLDMGASQKGKRICEPGRVFVTRPRDQICDERVIWSKRDPKRTSGRERRGDYWYYPPYLGNPERVSQPYKRPMDENAPIFERPDSPIEQ